MVLFSSTKTQLLIINNQNTFISDSVKQIVILSLAIFLSYKFAPRRFKTKSINLIEVIGKCFFYCLNYLNIQKKEELVESWSFNSLETQLRKKIHIFHNQQTAIFIFVLVFLILLFNILFLK